jgi:hypothetical protein
MAPTADPTSAPWGTTPLTAEGLARLDHPLSLSDFNQDAGGYWRMIRGQKTYYPREWFAADGTFTGTGTQSGDRAGQDQGFFKTGTHWNWQTGQWENPTNWANVIGLAAAGGVGAGIAAPLIAGALGGGGAAAGAGAPAYVGADLANTAAASLAGGAATGPSVLAALGGGAGLAKTALGVGVPAVTSLITTNKAVGAQEDATAAQAAATKYAADLQAKAAADALAFQRQQAAYDATQAETNRAANYDQWAAKQSLLGSVGQALGLPARSIPAYVPLPAYGNVTSPAPGGAGPSAAPGAAPASGAGGDPAAAAWWNPQDPKGSVAALLAGKPPTSQTLLDLAPQIEAAGGQVSPANAEGVTSKIYVPGVGWTRVLDGGVAGGPGGGQGTGWTFVPQGGAAAAAPTAAPAAYRYQPVDPLAGIQAYFADPTKAGGTLQIPTGTLANVGAYL